MRTPRIAGLALCLLIAGLPGLPRAAALDLPSGGGGAFSVPVRSLLETRFRATVRQQYDFSCGSAALATLLTHQYGLRISEEEAFREMYARGDQAKIRREGFSLLDMKRFLQGRGFEADGFEASLQNLQEAGLPAIALISENGYLHFVVVKGLRHGRVLFSDPSAGERLLPLERFEQVWQHRLLFVIHNRRELARFNRAEDWTPAPLAPLRQGIPRDSMFPAQRLGPGEF